MSPFISSEEAHQMVANGAQFVDVRNPNEFAGGAAPGSVNIPLPMLGERLGELDKSKPVVVVCAMGGRANAAKGMLLQSGFSRVENLGSWQNW